MEQEVIVQLEQQIASIAQERDSLACRLQRAETEIDELRRTVNDAKSLKTQYDHLLQDHESLRISLESSERIRMQQKELINLLQKAQSAADASVGLTLMSNVIPHSTQTIAKESKSWLNNSYANVHTNSTTTRISPRGGGSISITGGYNVGGDLDLGSAHHSNPNSPARPHHRGGQPPSSSAAALATTSGSGRLGGGGETVGGSRGGSRPSRTSRTRPPRTVSASPRQGGVVAASGGSGNTGTVGAVGALGNAWLEPGSSPSLGRRSLSAPSSPSRSQSYHSTGSGGGGGGLSSSSSLSHHRIGSSHTSRFDQHLASSLGSLGIGIGGMAGKQVGVGMMGGSSETRARASSFSSFDAAFGQTSMANPSSDPGLNYPSMPLPSLRSSSYPLGGIHPLGQSVDSKFVMDQARNREFLSQSDFQYPLQQGPTTTRSSRVANSNNHPITANTTVGPNIHNHTNNLSRSNHSRSPLRTASRIDHQSSSSGTSSSGQLTTGGGPSHSQGHHHHRVTTSPSPLNQTRYSTIATSSPQAQQQQLLTRSRSAPPVDRIVSTSSKSSGKNSAKGSSSNKSSNSNHSGGGGVPVAAKVKGSTSTTTTTTATTNKSTRTGSLSAATSAVPTGSSATLSNTKTTSNSLNLHPTSSSVPSSSSSSSSSSSKKAGGGTGSGVKKTKTKAVKQKDKGSDHADPLTHNLSPDDHGQGTSSVTGVRTRAFLQTKLPTTSSSGSSKQGSYQVAEATSSSSSSSSHHPHGQHLHSSELSTSSSSSALLKASSSISPSTSPSKKIKATGKASTTTTPLRSIDVVKAKTYGEEVAVVVEEIEMGAEDDDDEDVDIEAKQEDEVEEQVRDRGGLDTSGGDEAHEGQSGVSVGVWMGLGTTTPGSADNMAAQVTVGSSTEVMTGIVEDDPGVMKMSRKGGGGATTTKPSKGTKKIAASTTIPPSAKTASLMTKGGSTSGKEKEGGMTAKRSSHSSGKSKI